MLYTRRRKIDTNKRTKMRKSFTFYRIFLSTLTHSLTYFTSHLLARNHHTDVRDKFHLWFFFLKNDKNKNTHTLKRTQTKKKLISDFGRKDVLVFVPEFRNWLVKSFCEFFCAYPFNLAAFKRENLIVKKLISWRNTKINLFCVRVRKRITIHFNTFKSDHRNVASFSVHWFHIFIHIGFESNRIPRAFTI